MHNCAWCGKECDESVGSVREFKLTLITNGEELTNDPQIEWLYYCSRECRIQYLYYP